ncbi:MAG TPA: oligopeptide/dipeptide ABC transporter ATP-binding protein [Arthrobacter sp.]|nr:oligopeptide/dipeptide ABC transporter ATP-binding protein [Arthrobacter sp.]
MIDSSVGSDNLVSARDLTVEFVLGRGILRRGGARLRAVDGVSLEIARGTSVGLVGESGCGKSSLGRGLLGLVARTGGTLDFDGIDLGSVSRRGMRSLRRRMQLVYQDPYSSLDPRMTVEQLLEEPLRIHRTVPRAGRSARVSELLNLVSLDRGKRPKFPHELSGGQRQRVAIAQALASAPEFLVCDEPVSALDVSVQAQIINLLIDLREELGLTFLFIAHDLDIVKHTADRVLVMYLGKVVERGDTRQVFASARHPYTESLLAASPVLSGVREKVMAGPQLHDELPSAANVPTGCRFHPRCWLYQKLGEPEICSKLEPEEAEVALGHSSACHFAMEMA